MELVRLSLWLIGGQELAQEVVLGEDDEAVTLIAVIVKKHDRFTVHKSYTYGQKKYGLHTPFA